MCNWTAGFCYWESTVNFVCSHRLNHHQFLYFMLEIEGECPDLPYPTVIQWFSGGNIFLELRARTEIFLNEKNCLKSLLWKTEWLWKLVFAADLIMLLNDSTWNYRDITITTWNYNYIAYIWNFYCRKVIWWQLMFELQVTSNSIIYFSWYQKLRQARFPFPHKFAANTFSGLKLEFQQHFLDLDASVKKISIFQNLFNCTIEELPPNIQFKVTVLQCNAC